MKESFNAKYVGVMNWGTITRDEILREGAKVQRFAVFHAGGGTEEKLLALRQDADYSLLNKLIPGYNYCLEVEDEKVIGAELLEEIPFYQPLIAGVPGRKTLRNLLTTAFEPMGTVLYIFGGGWNWQDDRPNLLARSIGVSGTWVRFFNEHNNADYICKSSEDNAKAPYPYGRFNQFNALGIDCSGFVGWTIYNTFETENGLPEYSRAACRLAKGLDETHHLGTWHPGNIEIPGNYLTVGDVVSTDTHVWLCLGRCSDGSILLAHSSIENLDTMNGGGVQLSALAPDMDQNCEAYRLAAHYMKTYYPVWSKVHTPIVVPYEKNTRYTKDTCGRFSWNLTGPLSDPDGFSGKSAEEILRAIFNE